ncbi:MAG: hypothetical protein KAY65_14815 [Planctomycetes bacterium]|nr:hypothetical protein [Planctomycetota bacterium]
MPRQVIVDAPANVVLNPVDVVLQYCRTIARRYLSRPARLRASVTACFVKKTKRCFCERIRLVSNSMLAAEGNATLLISPPGYRIVQTNNPSHPHIGHRGFFQVFLDPSGRTFMIRPATRRRRADTSSAV